MRGGPPIIPLPNPGPAERFGEVGRCPAPRARLNVGRSSRETLHRQLKRSMANALMDAS